MEIKTRNPLNANPRTTVITSPKFPDKKGRIIRQFPKPKLIECWFRDVGFVVMRPDELIAVKDDGSLETVRGDESRSVHGTGAAGNRLAAFLKSKREKELAQEVAKKERAQWAEPMKTPTKQLSKKASKIIESGKSEDEINYQLRMNLTKDMGVSHKKGAKVRVNAEQVQK